jgi:nucleoside-diphosphate-sugar epimerase
MAEKPRLVITGAAGFLGRRLVETLATTWSIEAIDRNAPPEDLETDSGTVRWHRADIATPESIQPIFEAMKRSGGATALLHLAAHYDFTGLRHPEYQRTNVEGTRLLVELSRDLGLERFVLASSVAACDFPRRGLALTEASPPDGRHVYAESKRAGEQILRDAATAPTAIVRFAAMFSDWCEYPPFYVFLETWLGRGWNRSILGGRGASAVPYLHVRDACQALLRVLALRNRLDPAEVLIVSPNGATTHEELFLAATARDRGRPARPLKVPKPLAMLGIWGRYQLGRARGRVPFERPWMGPMIDRRLEVDARRSHARLAWQPRERLGVVRRLPFLLENRRSRSWLWAVHNSARLLRDEPPQEILAVLLLREREEEIFSALTAALLAERVRLPHDVAVALLRGLTEAIRTREREAFRELCLELARRRARLAMPSVELSNALRILERVCLDALERTALGGELRKYLRDALSGAIEFGVDGLEDGYEELGEGGCGEEPPALER